MSETMRFLSGESFLLDGARDSKWQAERHAYTADNYVVAVRAGKMTSSRRFFFFFFFLNGRGSMLQ